MMAVESGASTLLTSSTPNLAFQPNSWTNILRSATNFSGYAPSPKDLLLTAPRAGMRVAAFLLNLPDVLDGALSGGIERRTIPTATATTSIAGSTTTTASRVAAGLMVDMRRDNEGSQGLGARLSLDGGKSFGSIFSYVTSRWSLCCILMSIALNRTQVYASARRGVVLGWKARAGVRIVPILLFLIQAKWLLSSIQCQTSVDFDYLGRMDVAKSSHVLRTQNDRLLNGISSALLLGATDIQSCQAVGMRSTQKPVVTENPMKGSHNDMPTNSHNQLATPGSLSLLWPLFQTLCLSQFVETLSCAVQGQPLAAETGMTIFEHSLAFAEAEATVATALDSGKGLDDLHSGLRNASDVSATRSKFLQRANTSPEVLLVGFLSSMNHVTSHVLAIFNLQSRLRLASTAFWGLCFMSVITWSVFSFSIEDRDIQSLLRFPTVCIIGFIPHILVLAGIVLCASTFFIAMVLSSFSSTNGARDPGARLSFSRRLLSAHSNMQASIPLSAIRISVHMDFYTALLKTGFTVLTMASEAVYLNESTEVNIRQRTWLEEERLDEFEASGNRWLGPGFSANNESANSVGLVPSAAHSPRDSGYTKEMKAGTSRNTGKTIRDGVGAGDRSGKWIMVFKFAISIFLLIARWWTILALAGLSRIGLRLEPQWILRLIQQPKKEPTAARRNDETHNLTDLQFWMLSEDGDLVLPSDGDVDVELEVRKRLHTSRGVLSEEAEQQLDLGLYGWWLKGGWWGDKDSSGEFLPAKTDDEDATSVISTASAVSSHGWESDFEDDDGRTTPTQVTHGSRRQFISQQDIPISAADLAQLIVPKTPDQRAVAHILATHLSTDGVMTRSRVKRLQERERMKVLTTSRQGLSTYRSRSVKLEPDEEADMLEYLITSRRTAPLNPASDATSSQAESASGSGDDGPVCVVCQSAPRSIIVWPCRCLSLCDDCRITLAMNNFDKCVCCRRNVGSFSRIYVP